jgi:hypothetical protein
MGWWGTRWRRELFEVYARIGARGQHELMC